MNINEYTQLIKTEFLYLFKEYEFKMVYVHENKDRYSVFRIGLQSDICRILFVRERGAGVSFLGTLNAPFENEVNEQWVSLIGLLSFMLRKDFDWSFLEEISPDQRIQLTLSFISKQFKPYCKQLTELFTSEDKLAKWKPFYKQYVKENIRQSNLRKS